MATISYCTSFTTLNTPTGKQAIYTMLVLVTVLVLVLGTVLGTVQGSHMGG